ncbi:hypothetical protein Ddye_011497 [Dipteronia dyeriana]|uniref:RNase H type-1 domain-containing protein n=1 Tax=Dipteronia dyeriana TaxID=168575 RepID=A0AAE0CH26_9ROSI|nr:hypothetical protein Ddye_011497 [Dipteronia dyeriana]
MSLATQGVEKILKGDSLLKKKMSGDKLKFNVDGSPRGRPGLAGIGGVFRDSEGKVVCLFSLSVGIQDSNTAEILAFRKACELCDSVQRLAEGNIQIVSDSMVAVSWANSMDDFGAFLIFTQFLTLKGIF